MALRELDDKENVTEAPSNCNTSGAVWETGKRLFEYIRKQTLPDGTTGRVAFDEMGDRHGLLYLLWIAHYTYKVYNIYQGPKIVAPFHLLLVFKNQDDFKV